ncbi:MAG: serine hydrolase domain-containing protein, partial [Chitinophagaceae bacterium]
LDHRSGLPNYLDFMDSIWDKKRKATNEDVLQFMIVHKPAIQAQPDRVFHYCNTNFLLLAMVLEKITKQPYPQYMRDSLFIPLGMKHTYVFSTKDTLSYIPTYMGNRPYPMDHLDCTYGDKNIYSTVNDLLLWDKSLYQHTYINKQLLDLAFTPQSHEVKSMHNYGLAWRLFKNENESLIYHNGKWHGSNTVFTRVYEDTATIIILGNKFNRNIYKAKDIANIFTGKKDVLNLAE